MVTVYTNMDGFDSLTMSTFLSAGHPQMAGIATNQASDPMMLPLETVSNNYDNDTFFG